MLRSFLTRGGGWRRRFIPPNDFTQASFFFTLGATSALLFNYFYHQPSRGDDHFSPLNFIPIAEAAEALLPATVPSSPADSSTNIDKLSSSDILAKLGSPSSGQLRIIGGYLCAFDRRNRIPLWVMEHLTPDKLNKTDAVGNEKKSVYRQQFQFFEDNAELTMFRSTNKDYKGSGYDRGHMAAAGNYRYDKEAMGQTFNLANIAPQVGAGFNRDAWNDLEKYVRAIARRSNNVVIVTGPLFLPQRIDGKKRVIYDLIGDSDVAVPTHYFKALAIQEKPGGKWRYVSWVLPNMSLPDKINLKSFEFPVETVERASGLKLFPHLDAIRP